MEKREEINAALKEALKAKDATATATIRLMVAAMKDRDINARGLGRPEGINDTEILAMLQTMIKQRQESINIYRDAGREELAEREEDEIKVIERFLPAQMGDAEIAAAIDAIIKETGASTIRDMGKVMGEMKTRYAGQMDMGKAGGLVKAKLG